MKPQKPTGQGLSGLLACFFLSGAAALIYQIVWTKSLGLLFGYSAYALATVLAVFMGGLALGSAWLGKISERSQNPIALYAWIEFGVAASGGLSLAGLAGVRVLYFILYPHFSSSRIELLVLRFAGAAIVLLVPTFLMGGTLPILIRGVARNSSILGARVSRFYAINTMGAVIGALAAGFVLLPAFGLRVTLLCAVLLNAIGGVAAWRLARTKLFGEEPLPQAALAKHVASKKERGTSQASASSGFLLAAFFLVGATAIAYEIAWTRLLATTVGSSTYAFTLMLATFLGGIVLGSLLFEKWSARHGDVTQELFSWTQLATAIAALLFLIFFRQLPGMIPPILRATHNSFGGLILAQFVTSCLAMLPAAIVFGFNFPAVVVLIAGKSGEEGRISSRVGLAYAANTCGAILAAMGVGFFLLPGVGSFRIVALAAIGNLLLAAALSIQSRMFRWAALAAHAMVFAAILLTGWSPYFYNRALASFGTVLYGSYHSDRLTAEEIANTEDVLFLEDGINATIAVTRTEDYVALKTNGKVDASNIDTSTQLLLGDLGAIFHRRPRRVLVVGFGGGMTVSAVARFPDVEQIDCVEIEPAVLRASPFLERLHRGAQNDPRVHIYFDDARNFIQTAREPYDLIISEPSNPWIAGVASLYTTQFYAALRGHLAAGGIFVQWIQAYSLRPDDLGMILATIAPHFSDVSLWHSAGRDLLVLARTDSSPLNFDRSRSLWSNTGLREDFHTLELMRPESWPVYFRWNDSEVRGFAAGAALNTDDHTRLEYQAPLALLREDLTQELEAEVRHQQHDLLPAEIAVREIAAARLGSAESAVELKSKRAMDFVQALEPNAETGEYDVLLARGYLLQGNATAAREKLQSAHLGGSNQYSWKYWLAIANHSAGAVLLAENELDELVAGDLKNEDALRARISFARDAKDWPVAIAGQEKLIAAQSDPTARDHCELGDLRLRAGDLRAAEAPLQEGLRRDPYSYLCHRDLGELQRASGRNQDARLNLEFVIRYFPEADAKSYASLALVYRMEKASAKMREILRKGLRIFPGDDLLQHMLRQTN
jgi:spermidine synthase